MRFLKGKNFCFSFFALISICLNGCWVIVRAPGNHSLWHARLPDEPNYQGVTFILENPPKADFAFLLAQKYPASYVVYCPSPIDAEKQGSEEKGGYIYVESKVGYGWLQRKSVKTLQRNLFFHHEKVTSCENLPDDFLNNACIRLSWSEIEPNSNPFDSRLTSHYFLSIPFDGLTGLGPPLPYWDANKTQVLNIRIDGQERRQIVAPWRAEMKLYAGMWWEPPLALFYSDTKQEYSDAGEYPEHYSPGGWAYCLEHLLRNPTVRDLDREIGHDLVARRETTFNDMFKQEGFDLEPAPEPEPCQYPGQAGHGKSWPFFGKEWPNICLLRDSNGNHYFWKGSSGGKNWLSHVETKSEKPSKVVIDSVEDSDLQSLDVAWQTLDYAVYELQWFADANLAQLVGSTTVNGSYFRIEGLAHGKPYWVRIRALRANQTGPWSDSVMGVVKAE